MGDARTRDRDGHAVSLPTGGTIDLTAWWHDAVDDRAGRGVAVLAPGVAVPARTMRSWASALAGDGWTVLRVEFPGVGASPLHPRDVPGGMAEWATRDLDAAILAGAERAAGRPLVLVGHSAGAWLVALSEQAHRLDAVLALASMSGEWRHLKRSAWPFILAGQYVFLPLFDRLIGWVPGWVGLGEHAPGGALREWARWCRRRGFLFADPDVTVTLDRLVAPVRVLLPTDDAWATPEAVDAVWRHATATSYELVEVDPADHGGTPIGHVGLLRDRLADLLWPEQLAWLARVTAGRTPD